MHKEVSFSLPINCFCACLGQGDARPLRVPSFSSVPLDSLAWGKKSQTQILPWGQNQREGGKEAERDFRGDRFLRKGGIRTGLQCMGMSFPGREGHSKNENSIKAQRETVI